MQPDFSGLTRRRVEPIVDAKAIALARSPSGFVLAVERESKVLSLIPLDDAGSVRGPITNIAGAHRPLLAPRGTWSQISGGPLLGYTNEDSGQVALLLADSAAPEAPATIVGGGAHFSTAVFTGDGFLYAFDGNYAGVLRVGLDGRAGPLSPLGSGLSEWPQLAWAEDHAVVTFFDFAGQRLAFRKVDRDGAALAELVELGRNPAQGNRSPVIALESGDIGVLLGGFTGEVDHATALGVVRLNADGNAVATPIGLVKDPLRVTDWRAARLGTDVIVAWLGSADQTGDHTRGGLHLARVTP
jgi:hypothetical protein